MLKEELQSYLERVYSFAKINSPQTLVGKVHIRFELGGEELENGTIERVNQATERAHTIFNDTFQNKSSEIFILIYEYRGLNCFNTSNSYLHQQFSIQNFDKFYNQLEILDPPDEEDVHIIVGKLPVHDINVKNILNGIANLEMGFDPCINQSIYFIDPITDKAYYMYDDRGCFVWSNEADKIRNIYLERNDWIVDYHRPEIDECFKKR
jgi:hypothetical protein